MNMLQEYSCHLNLHWMHPALTCFWIIVVFNHLPEHYLYTIYCNGKKYFNSSKLYPQKGFFTGNTLIAFLFLVCGTFILKAFFQN